MFTDTALRNLKPGAASYKLADRDGMYVTVSTAGTIAFRYDYRLNGRRETLTIGRYGPAGISLAMAREKLLGAKMAETTRSMRKSLIDRDITPVFRKEMTQRNMSIQPTLTERPGLKADLDRDAALHAQIYGETVDAIVLIPYMLEAFMARDRGFRRDSGGHRTLTHTVASSSPEGQDMGT